MPAARVVVRPMDDAAFFVPDVFAVEANTVAHLECVDARCDVDVVSGLILPKLWLGGTAPKSFENHFNGFPPLATPDRSA